MNRREFVQLAATGLSGGHRCLGGELTLKPEPSRPKDPTRGRKCMEDLVLLMTRAVRQTESARQGVGGVSDDPIRRTRQGYRLPCERYMPAGTLARMNCRNASAISRRALALDAIMSTAVSDV